MHRGAGPQFECQRALFGHRIDGDYRFGPRCYRAEQCRQPDAAQAPDRNAFPRPHHRRIEHGADSGQHRAAKERSDFGGHIAVDLYRRAFIDNGVAGKGRQPEMMVHRMAAFRQAPAATEQFAAAIGGGAIGAQPAFARHALHTMPARWQEGQDDAVTHRKATVGTRRQHRRTGFMAERHGHRAHPVSIDHRQIGMAQAGSFDAHQQLARPRCREIEFRQPQRPGFGKGLHCMAGIEHGGDGLHGTAFPAVAARLIWPITVSR